MDVIVRIEQLTGFRRHLGPLSGNEPKTDDAWARQALAIFAYGTNLGPQQMARHLRGQLSADQIAHIDRRHMTAEKLDAALRDVINCFNRYTLPHYWGDEKRAAADGTQYELAEENLLAEQHIRYGGFGGIAYHHVSDMYIMLFTQFIACGVWEAVHILDGLIRNRSDVSPTTVHADTQGQNLPVFGLSYMLGIKLLPRIRNWKDLKFYRPSKETTYEHIDALFRDNVIDWNLLATHWQDLLRVAISIQEGKVLPSILLRKLTTSSHKNRLYQAFHALGCVNRTVFLLTLISDVKLREVIHRATNKVEQYNALEDWVRFAGGGTMYAHAFNESIYEAGAEVTVPPNTPHAMWNAGEDVLHQLIELQPALRSETFFETIVGLEREGKLPEKGAPNLLQMPLVLLAYDNPLAMPPRPIQTALFAILAALGWLVGYRSWYPRYSPYGPVVEEKK